MREEWNSVKQSSVGDVERRKWRQGSLNSRRSVKSGYRSEVECARCWVCGLKLWRPNAVTVVDNDGNSLISFMVTITFTHLKLTRLPPPWRDIQCQTIHVILLWPDLSLHNHCKCTTRQYLYRDIEHNLTVALVQPISVISTDSPTLNEIPVSWSPYRPGSGRETCLVMGKHADRINCEVNVLHL